MQYELTKLKNNLNTLFVHSPGSTAGTIQIWFRAGSALEKNDHEGIAHFLEHMFFKGTKTRPGAKIAHEVETFGGEINAFTSFDYTCYYINTPNTRLPDSINILLDMVANPEFKQEDLVPERDVVFEEYRRSIDSPGQFAFSKLQNSAFSGAYAHQILGREETIKNFSREQLQFFRNSYYNLTNTLFIVAGDLTNKEEIIKVIENYKLPEGPESLFPEFELKKNSTIDVHQKEIGMATLTMVIKAPVYSSTEAASEDLAINCLGFGETSRLYDALVLDKTLANVASASTMFMAHGGAHFIRLVFPYKNMSELLAKFTKTIVKAIDEGLAADEVQKIKNQYLSSKIYEMESIESFSFSLGHSYAQNGDIKCEEEFIERIKNTNANAVNKSLRNIFSQNMHMSLQIPKEVSLDKSKKELQKFQKSLELVKKSLTEKSKSKLKIEKSKHDQQVQLIKIKPGVSLLYRQNKMTPTFVFQAYLRGGITEETTKTNGIYHLLSSMLTKGHNKISYEKIKQTLEEKSSSINGFSGKNAYGLLMHGLTENLHDLFPHFAGALTHADMPIKYLKHEKQLAGRALTNQKEDPVKHCFKEAQKLFFGNHPYALNPIGSEATLKSIPQVSLINLHKKNIKTKEILLTYCGDSELDDVLDILGPLLSELPARKSSKLIYKKYKSTVGVERFISFNREQTQIFYGIPCGKTGSPENLYLKMLSAHLSGQSSELFVEVRDRLGLCYSAQPVHFAAIEGGYFGIYMASGHDKVAAATVAIKDLLRRIRDNGLALEDFNRIKTMIKGQNLINVQTNEDFASIYSVPVLQDQGLDYYYKGNLEIEKLSHTDFQKNIKKILSQKWNTIIVGREFEGLKNTRIKAKAKKN
ncbi:MAG: pitrilysin family protein [Bacteriovorax sp.]|nr:pitrilysin family protein [Bacteriovorax sp.]